MRRFLHHETGFVFHHNSDLSEMVTIVGRHQGSIAVPGSALLAFMAEYIRQTRITEIENMTTEELLGKVK